MSCKHKHEVQAYVVDTGIPATLTVEVTKRQNGREGYYGGIKLGHVANDEAKLETCTAANYTRSMLSFASKQEVRLFDEHWATMRDLLLASKKLPESTPGKEDKPKAKGKKGKAASVKMG